MWRPFRFLQVFRVKYLDKYLGKTAFFLVKYLGKSACPQLELEKTRDLANELGRRFYLVNDLGKSV